MKKYKVTEKHGFFKKGIITWWPQHHELAYTGNNNDCIYFLNYTESNKQVWLKDNWIEEIQDPEFTSQDMTAFAVRCIARWQKDKSILYDEELEKYKNGNKS